MAAPDVPPGEMIAPLAHAFGVTPDALPMPTLTMDDVRRFVAARVSELLQHRPDHLLSILYRVDVAEVSVKQAFAETAPGELPYRLAELLIERQLQKLRLRRHYKGTGD